MQCFDFLYNPQMLHSTKLINISWVKVVSDTSNQNQHLWFSCQKERGRLLLSSETGLSRWRQGKALNAGWALTLVGFLHAACKDQWEEGCGARHSFKMVWVWQDREEELMISSHRVAFPFLYVCCSLLTYQCFCWRVSSKSFCLSLGIGKKQNKTIYLVTAPSLYSFIIYTPIDFGREELTLMGMCVTMIPSKYVGNPI